MSDAAATISPEAVTAEHFDVLIVGAGMSGIDALKILRESDETRHIPVVAISAAVMPDEIKRGSEAGFDDYLTKPIQVPEVMKAINEYIG